MLRLGSDFPIFNKQILNPNYLLGGDKRTELMIWLG